MTAKKIIWGALLFLSAAPACRAAEGPAASTEVHIDAYYYSARPEATPALMQEHLQELKDSFQFQYEKIQNRHGKHFVIHPKPRPLKAGVVPAPADLSFEQTGRHALIMVEGEEGRKALETLMANRIEPAVIFLLRVPDPHTLRFSANTAKVVNYMFYEGGVVSLLPRKESDPRLQNVVVRDTEEFRLDNATFRELVRDTQRLAIIEAFQTRGKPQEAGSGTQSFHFEEYKPEEEKAKKKA